MSKQLGQRIFDELEKIVLIDPHSHINPHSAASETLADIMGYHYYTELAHAAGLPREQIEEPGLDPKEKVSRLVPMLAALDNTVQVSWLIEMCREFFDFSDDRITPDNWESLYDTAASRMAEPDWEDQVLKQSGLERIFLTNDFDDPLEGFDTDRYIPCLRTDDLVFHLAKPETQERLAKASGIVDQSSVEPILQSMLAGRSVLTEDESQIVSRFIFWTLAEMCAEHRLPFDLMIGVNRRVYESGVHQGQDLFDSRTSLLQYRALFNAFPQVTFPVSVLAQTSNQELVSYSWIFPNVVTNGHWWYSNIPAYIELDCRSRLEAVPRTKQIGYYSDMYKLEFALPKFRMYRQVLAGVLGRDFVIGRGWSEEEAVSLGRQVLRGNVETIFNC